VLIFKIVHSAEWSGAVRAGSYGGSPKDRADGYLHFSNAEQLEGTFAKYYAGMNDLLLVCVDADRLGAALKFEVSRDGALFPHLYEPLALTSVIWAKPIVLVDGVFELPKDLAANRG
jgi:uncharacterized protein (DUF952 family)